MDADDDVINKMRKEIEENIEKEINKNRTEALGKRAETV